MMYATTVCSLRFSKKTEKGLIRSAMLLDRPSICLANLTSKDGSDGLMMTSPSAGRSLMWIFMLTFCELLLNANPDSKLTKLMKDKERTIVFFISGSHRKAKQTRVFAL